MIATTNKKARVRNTAKQKPQPRKLPAQQEGQHAIVNTSEVVFSPFNYRKHYSKPALESFAAEIRLHGIIAPLLVRNRPEGGYELVAGERRLRAAKIARLKQVPILIKDLTDDEVIEMQLAENIQREDPHPFHEAQAIGRMLEKHQSIEEIATRLGKSKQFVYNRTKLLALIPPFQEMLVADALTLQQAVTIASLAPASQEEYFNGQCNNWKEQEDFRLHNIDYYINRLVADLKQAPFNTKDKNLLPEVGACTRCPFNTATLKTLFPEYAKEATCTNKGCYTKKCNAAFTIELTAAFMEHTPQGILYYGGPTVQLQEALATIPEAASIPHYNLSEVETIEPPRSPDKEDYEEVDEDTGELILNETAYQQDLADYETELQEYNQLMNSDTLLKGLSITRNCIETVLFNPQPKSRTSSPTVTAKEVQAAIKEGSATPELLQAEINRIEVREQRAKELDAEKVQLTIHEQFSEAVKKGEHSKPAAKADLLATRFLIYQTLGYSERTLINSQLFNIKSGYGLPDNILSLLSGLKEKEHALLVRLALLNDSSSKQPTQEAGELLRTVATAAGFNVQAVVEQQQQKTTEREARAAEKIAVLQTKIGQLNKEE